VAQILADLAEGLAQKGRDVHLLTSGVNYMTQESLRRHDTRNGVRIWRLPNLPLKKDHPLSRVAAYGGFLALSGPAMLLMPVPDVVVYLSAPPLLAWSSFPLKWRGHVKTVYWAQDVYPEVAIEMGYLKNAAARRAMTVAENRLEQGVDRVVAIGDRMKNVFERKGVLPERIRVIPNWSVVKTQAEVSRNDNPLLRRLGLLDRFVVQYSGNMGVVHDMALIAQAMIATRTDEELHWLMIGGGKRRGELEAAVRQNDLHNTTFAPYQPLDELWISLRAADVALISLRPEMEGLVVPSKLYGAMEAGVPIVFIGSDDGEVASTLRRFDCGLTVSRCDELVHALTQLKNDPERRRTMGENGQRAYNENYDRGIAIDRFDAMFQELLT